MNPDFQRVKSLFLSAAEKRTPADRSAFLEEACGGDDSLRGQVEVLLNAHDDADSFLKPMVIPNAKIDDSSAVSERPGTIIGPYKLLQEIGEGGMGTVFLAEQTEPVRRKVALKIIKPGLDSAQVLARFEAERQALALMDHPNIARVLDAGTTASGRPFFVMELVKGASITTYCDENRMTPRQRLELFIPVCQAIQHAHQKGIIHRDIKPSNILVALYDSKPVPKVIDFGIAKAIDQQLTERTLFTKHGQIVGTFEYMSPEQATLDALDVDTRSDIYSLGVLLYELLTGTTPLDKERLRQAALGEVLRLIREEEPPRPSVRLSGSGGALSLIAAYRQTESQKLPWLMRGDLDWIVMKGLDKDRARRYETASAFAADVRRHLAEEPVEARPPSAGYRLRKYIKRNRGTVVAAAAILLALLTGTLAATVGLFRARDAEADAVAARDNEMRQRLLAMSEKDQADLARRQALDNEQKARANAALALKQEHLAKNLAKIAADEKKNAELARKKAEENENKAEWRLYVSQIALAHKAWESNDVPLLHHYLGQCRLDFRGWEHDYLFTLPTLGNQALRGHTNSIFDVAFSPDGTVLASAGGPRGAGELNLWDTGSGKLLRSLPGHTSWIRSVSFSPDGKRLASASGDKSVKVWDVASGKNILSLGGHQGTVWRVAFSPDGKLLASVSGKFNGQEIGDGELKLWDASTGAEKASLLGHTSTVYGIAFSPDSKRLASGSMDKTVKLWDLATFKEIRTLTGFTNMVYTTLQFSRDGKLLVCSEYGRAKLWETENWQELRTIEVGGTGRAVFSPDAKVLACAADNNTVKLFEIASGKEVRTLKAHAGNVTAVAYSPDGKRLASGGGDSTVRLWDLDAGQENRPSKGAEKPPVVALSRDGARLAKVAENGSLQVLDAVSGQPIVTLEEKSDPFARLTFSPDGKRLAGISSHDVLLGFPVNDELKVWNLAGAKALGTFKCDLASRLMFSPDSSRLAAVSTSLYGPKVGEEVLMWNLDTNKKTQISNGPENNIGAMVFSPDSQRLAIAWDDRLWRFRNKAEMPKNSEDKGQIHLWTLGADQRFATLKGHSDAVQALAFSLDGKRLASASSDKTIKLWDPASGDVLLTLFGHTNQVRSVAFSPDGKRLASAAMDRTVKLWDTTSGQEVLSWTTNYATHLVFSPDGKRLSSTTMSKRFGIPAVIGTWDASKSMSEVNQK